MQNGMENVHARSSLPGMSATNHLVKNDREGKQVTSVINRLAKDLFRRHIPNRTQHLTGRGQIHIGSLAETGNRRRKQLRQAKVEQLHVTVWPHHDIFGFQVAMYDAGTMCVAQRFQNLFGEGQRLVAG